MSRAASVTSTTTGPSGSSTSVSTSENRVRHGGTSDNHHRSVRTWIFHPAFPLWRVSSHYVCIVASPVPSGAHEWVSFPDPDEDRTWVFDVTFLESSWTCIYGRGCHGVLTGPADELVQGCCSYGAHFTGKKDVKRVSAAAATLTDEQWQYKSKALPRAKERSLRITRRAKDGTLATRTVAGACIFLNRPGFPGGPGCALHRAALDAGYRLSN